MYFKDITVILTTTKKCSESITTFYHRRKNHHSYRLAVVVQESGPKILEQSGCHIGYNSVVVCIDKYICSALHDNKLKGSLCKTGKLQTYVLKTVYQYIPYISPHECAVP